MFGLGVAGTVCHMGGRVDFTLCSRVRHWDRLWYSPIKGEGDSVGCVVLLSPHPVDSRLRGNDGPGPPPLWIDESLITLCQCVRF